MHTTTGIAKAKNDKTRPYFVTRWYIQPDIVKSSANEVHSLTQT